MKRLRQMTHEQSIGESDEEDGGSDNEMADENAAEENAADDEDFE